MPKRFLLLSARGWRTSRDKFCVVFLFFPGFLGLLGSQGEPGFYFFTGTLWKGSFFGGRLCFFSAFPVAPPNVYTNSLLKAGLGL